jgi:hypothetical protein
VDAHEGAAFNSGGPAPNRAIVSFSPADTYEHMRIYDTEAIRRLLENLPQQPVLAGIRSTAPGFLYATLEASREYLPPSPDASDREILEHMISTAFNANLAEAQVSVRHEAGEFRHVLVFSRPIVAVYWMAAAALSNGLVRHCEYCRAPFVVEEPRQQYCPPIAPWGRASACSANQRKQRQRATTAQLRKGPKKAAATDKRRRTI